MQTIETTWNELVYDFKSKCFPNHDALKGLVENRYAAIVLKNALEPETIDKAVESIQGYYTQATVTQYANGSLTTIGPYLAKFLHRVDDYFKEARMPESLFPDRFGLPYQVKQKLIAVFNLRTLEVATEPDGRRYAPFIIRIHADGVMNPLHNDNIMRDAALTSLSLAQLTYQVSCIVCLQECEEGGELFHYKKLWNPEDEKYKIINGIGYKDDVINGKPCFIFKPQKGDIYLIDPTNYHEISRVSGTTRLTFSFFIGFFNSDLKNAVVWS